MSRTTRNQKNQAGNGDGAAKSDIVAIRANRGPVSARLDPFLWHYFQEERLPRRRRDDDEPAPARRTFSVQEYTSNPSFMAWYVERHPSRPAITQELVRQWRRHSEEQYQKRRAENEHITRRLCHPKCKAWFNETHPDIGWDKALMDNLFTRAITDEFDVFMGQPEIDEFCEIAFDDNIDVDWPYEFRRWAKDKHGVGGPKDVTLEIIADWRQYDDARNRLR